MTESSCPPILPDRVLLATVPKVGFEAEGGRCPELTPFPSCLRACLEFLGEDHGAREIQAHGSAWRLDELYVTLMGTSGAAFRLSWMPGWSLDNVDIQYTSNDPAAPFQRAFEAVGYGCEIVCGNKLENEVGLAHPVLESIARGVPVLGFGVVGPPECCILAGYEDEGNAVTGWSFFQGFEEFNQDITLLDCGQFRKGDWVRDLQGLIFIGGKLAAPDPAEIRRQSLYWALAVARTPWVFPDRHKGIAAYKAWAEHLLRDEDFRGLDQETLRLRLDVHDDAAMSVAEGRWYAARYMEQTAGYLPWAAEELARAAAHYDRIHDRVWDMWALVGGIGRDDEKALKLAEPQVRRDAARIIEELAGLDEKAAACIDTALTDKQPR